MRKIAFAELRGDPRGSESTVVLAGRCWEGPIRVDDVFTEVELSSGETQLVTLRVTGITFYGRPVSELGSTETAELTLSGGLEQSLATGAVLRGIAGTA